MFPAEWNILEHAIMANIPYTQMVTLVTENLSQDAANLQIPIPPGQQLVIQHVTFSGAIQANVVVLAQLTTSSTQPGSTPTNSHQLVLTPVIASPGNVQWMCSQPVTFYADGTGVTLSIGVSPTAPGQKLLPGALSVTATVSGYLTTP
jgi:hypothetical protein